MPESKLSPSQEMANKYLLNFIQHIPLTLVKGKGMYVWDENGNKYLDFVGGWAVDSLGHCPSVVVGALSKQAKTLIQVSNAYYTIPQAQLAELLVKNSLFKRVFFSNSGAEAVEGAIKLARRWGHLKLNGAYEVITAENSFHGRTLATLAATGQAKFQKPYEPMPQGFISVEYNNIKAIRKATSERTCAVLLEPVQGEGGVNIPSENYFKEIRAWCDEKGLLMMLDEVQTGVGRLGKLFGYELFEVKPDVITLAKGLGSGVPIGAILASDKASVFAPGDHGSTFGGNPLCTAVGLEVLKYVIEKDIPANAAKMGSYLLSELLGLKKKYPFIKDVRGRGLLIALELEGDLAESLMYACLGKGLMINQLKPNIIRFIPPLIVSRAEIDQGLIILDQALAGLKV
jgi:acetylornithine/N-succinyldiaminopimelate aminotransferase